MNLTYETFVSWHLWIAAGVYALTLIPVIRTAPWWVLMDNSISHAFLGTCVFLIVMWNISTTMLPGLDYHYLGAMLLTLMFRWQLAFIAINLVLFSFILSGGLDWRVFPLSALILGLVPVMAAYGWHVFSERNLPNHFFVYIFVNAFFGAGFVILISILTASSILLFADVYTLSKFQHEYFPFLPLMIFPEAFITGTLITLLVAFKPNWVMTFDDVKYLQKR